jgi:hypothetical protein
MKGLSHQTFRSHRIIIRPLANNQIAIRLSQIYPKEMFLLILGKLKQHLSSYNFQDIDGNLWIIITPQQIEHIYTFAYQHNLCVIAWQGGNYQLSFDELLN